MLEGIFDARLGRLWSCIDRHQCREREDDAMDYIAVEALELLRALVAACESGRLDASAAEVNGLRGAVAALESLTAH